VRVGDCDQLVGVEDWERAQHDRIDEREDCGRRAEAERKGDDGGQSGAGRFEEQAARLPERLEHGGAIAKAVPGMPTRKRLITKRLRAVEPRLCAEAGSSLCVLERPAATLRR
jgi:hypothetical protein